MFPAWVFILSVDILVATIRNSNPADES